MRNEELRKQLEELRLFLEPDIKRSANEIVNWVSKCVAFFAAIEMNESIIQGFMRAFETKEMATSDGVLISSNLGPFQATHDPHFSPRVFTSIYDKEYAHDEILYIRIAFQTARNIIEKSEDAERLIPKSLVNFFTERTQYSHISSSLELLEQNFENKDSSGMIANSMTLLGSILDLDQTLKGKELSLQLKNIRANKELMEKFGLRAEIQSALDNSRILRNNLASHKSLAIEYNIPYAVALSAAYLVIFVLKIVMAEGELIK